MRFLRKYYKFLITCIIIFAITFVVLLVDSFVNFITISEIRIALLILFLASTCAGVVTGIYIINTRTTFGNIARQNAYNFGESSSFFDVQTFINIVEKAKKNRAKKGLTRFICAFTASNEIISLNLKRDKNIADLNKEISKQLTINLITSRRNSKRQFIFGFSRGIFYLCSFGKTEDELRQIIESITKWIYEIKDKNNFKFFIQPMFGVSPYPQDKNISEAIDNALLARNCSEKNFEQITFYHEGLRKTINTSMAKDIEEGLEKNEFVVYYQPKFSLVERKFTSSEALVRWNSSKHGMLNPGRFIPTAEAAGLVHNIDAFVFERVLQDISNTIRRGHRVMPVSVNFSLFEFFSTKFLDNILTLLEQYNVDPKLIQIEITETTSQSNQFLSVTIIKKLQEKGIKILMDDFGVGFSNIGNLRKIPFDCIKIDKSYIDNIDTDSKSAEIVRFLIQLCKVNGMEVVAEGVSTAKQVELLKKYKCDVIQGWYYSKALSFKDFEAFLLDNRFEKKEKEAK